MELHLGKDPFERIKRNLEHGKHRWATEGDPQILFLCFDLMEQLEYRERVVHDDNGEKNPEENEQRAHAPKEDYELRCFVYSFSFREEYFRNVSGVIKFDRQVVSIRPEQTDAEGLEERKFRGEGILQVKTTAIRPAFR